MGWADVMLELLVFCVDPIGMLIIGPSFVAFLARPGPDAKVVNHNRGH